MLLIQVSRFLSASWRFWKASGCGFHLQGSHFHAAQGEWSVTWFDKIGRQTLFGRSLLMGYPSGLVRSVCQGWFCLTATSPSQTLVELAITAEDKCQLPITNISADHLNPVVQTANVLSQIFWCPRTKVSVGLLGEGMVGTGYSLGPILVETGKRGGDRGDEHLWCELLREMLRWVRDVLLGHPDWEGGSDMEAHPDCVQEDPHQVSVYCGLPSFSEPVQFCPV